jgi:hypothetical protein
MRVFHWNMTPPPISPTSQRQKWRASFACEGAATYRGLTWRATKFADHLTEGGSSNGTPRVHHAARRRGGCVAARGACAARPRRLEPGGEVWVFAAGSVANLDARPIPPIPIPNGSASGPIAWRFIDGSRRYVDGGWLIVAGAARCRGSKQCTNCQATNNAGGYFTTPSNRNPGCTR